MKSRPKFRRFPETGRIYIPQDMDYPGIRMDVNRVHAAELGARRTVADQRRTALNSNVMIAQLLG